MSALLKDSYSASFYDKLSSVLASTMPSFDRADFINRIYVKEFEEFELKQRMIHTAKVFGYFLPDDFCSATEIVKRTIENLRAAGIREKSIEFMFIPEYIALFGLDNFQASMSAFEFVTQFTSCEFAVRPFILKYEKRTLKQMLLWSKHSNQWVRRLASEGSRPRLPWAIALPNLKDNPRPVLPILENLKNDGSATVRRSVANNLNDISKDNPETVLETAKNWSGFSKETDALIKHACRTLLKQGHMEVLKHFGFSSDQIVVSNFEITTPVVSIGGKLEFSFAIQNADDKNTKMRLEYGLYYKKNNGELSKKVFKISEREIEPNKIYKIERKQSFKRITTRKFYAGIHRISIIVNGKESESKEFSLTN
jgi:3-methyladenine DNA glycosylase AlkC